jgi:hypothetical protein
MHPGGIKASSDVILFQQHRLRLALQQPWSDGMIERQKRGSRIVPCIGRMGVVLVDGPIQRRQRRQNAMSNSTASFGMAISMQIVSVGWDESNLAHEKTKYRYFGGISYSII